MKEQGKNWGFRVRAERLRRKWTQDFLAEYAGISRSSVQAAEAATVESDVGLRVQRRIGAALELEKSGWHDVAPRIQQNLDWLLKSGMTLEEIAREMSPESGASAEKIENYRRTGRGLDEIPEFVIELQIVTDRLVDRGQGTVERALSRNADKADSSTVVLWLLDARLNCVMASREIDRLDERLPAKGNALRFLSQVEARINALYEHYQNETSKDARTKDLLGRDSSELISRLAQLRQDGIECFEQPAGDGSDDWRIMLRQGQGQWFGRGVTKCDALNDALKRRDEETRWKNRLPSGKT